MLENSMKKLARLISGQYKIEVYFQGKQPYTNGKAIYLPALPNKIDVEFRKEIEGFLDHEVAHCLFTDFGVSKFDNDLHRFMTNACEDSRIEKLMIDKYPGCRYNLDFINDKWGKINEQRWSELPAIFRVCDNVRRIMDGKSLRLDSDTKALFTPEIIDLALTLREVENTSELHKITKKITHLILKHKKEQQTQQKDEQDTQGESEQDTQGESEQDTQGDEGEQDVEGEQDAQGDEGEQDAQGDEGEQDTQGDEGEQDVQGDEGAQGDQQDVEGEQGEQDAQGDEGEQDAQEGDEGEQDAQGDEGEQDVESEQDAQVEYNVKISNEDIRNAVTDLLEDTQSEVPTDIHSYIEEHLKSIFDNEQKEYVAAKLAQDRTVDLSRNFDKDYQRAVAPLRGLIDKTAIELDEILTSESDTGWLIEQNVGAINNKDLVKVLTSPGYDRPFKTRKREENRSISISLVIDQSGSMCGNKIQTAKKAAIILAESLKALDIDFEIGGFTTTGERIKTGATRNEALVLTIYKSFDSENIQSLMDISASYENVDGESIRFFAERLYQQQNKRKIMFVLSDGEPWCNGVDHLLLQKDLKDAIRDIESAEIEVVGIGIETDIVEAFYPKNIVVNDVEQLPKVLMNKLKNMLVS